MDENMNIDEWVAQKRRGEISTTVLNRLLKPLGKRWCPGVPKQDVPGHVVDQDRKGTCKSCTYAHVMGKPRQDLAPPDYITVGAWARNRGIDYGNLRSDTIQNMRKRIDPRPVNVFGWWYAHKDAEYVPPMRDVVQGWKRLFDETHRKYGLMWCSRGVHQQRGMGHAAKVREGWRSYACVDCLRDDRYRRVYGIGLDEVNSMLERQGSTCALCDKELSADTLNVDHCHESGRVRGLLCSRCNLNLGIFESNFSGEKMTKVLKYLS